MIFRARRLPRKVLTGLALLSLAACGVHGVEVPPMEAARAALARGDGVGAEIALRKLLDRGTPKADLAAYMGEAELAQERLPEARDWLGPADFSAETRGYGMHMLGVLEMREGDLQAAGRAFDRALEASPQDASLWVDIGRLRYAGGEQVGAIAASKRAVELAPKDPEALQFRGQLIREADGLAAALPWFEAALDTDPANPDLLAEYAATLGDLGRAKDMLAVVRRLAEAAPGDPRIYYLQAVLAARAGKFDLARGLLVRAGDLAEELPAAALLSGIVDLQNGNFATAAQAFDRLADEQPDNRRVRNLLALALHLAGNDRELVYRFGDAALGPDAGPYLADVVGRAWEVLGERDKAAMFLSHAARQTVPGPVPIGSDADATLVQTGEMSGTQTRDAVRRLLAARQGGAAATVAEAFRRRHPGSSDALSLAGDARFAAGQFDAAIARYRDSAAIRRSWPLLRRLAASLLAQGERSAARAVFEEQVANEPANREAAAMLAVFAYDAGAWGQGDALLDHAFASGGDHDPQLWAMRSVAELERGRTEEALVAAQRGYRIQRANPFVAETLAHALAASGRDDAAAAVGPATAH